MTFKKVFFFTALLLLLVLIVGYVCSPYHASEKYPYKVVEHTVTVNVPVDSLFRMLGNSGFARQWSVFVHHITPLNPSKVADGKPGSKRRCFANEDETGITWDEDILIVEPSKRRQLSIYNLKGFKSESNDLRTEQLYEIVDSNSCKLTFVFFRDEKNEMEWWKQALICFEAYNMESVFKENMTNIKYLAEEGANYKRIHEFNN